VQKHLDELRRLVDRFFERWEIRLTEGLGHGIELARTAANEDFDLIAAVGGDGTCNEVVNGLLSTAEGTGAPPKTVFTAVPFGTGSDLIRSMAIPRDTSQALWLASTGLTLPADAGRATLVGPDGDEVHRYFFNVAGFGSNGEVVSRANRSSKALGGRVTFLQATLATVLTYKPQRLALCWSGPDGEKNWEGLVQAAFLANGHYCGGGMWVAPGGSLFDGALDLIVLPPLSPLASARHLHRLYNGSMEKVPGVFRASVQRFEARACQEDGAPVLIDIDGEQPGKLPFAVETVRGALMVRGGWSQNPVTTGL